MTSSLLLFTFSPIQPFISEARRAADLYTGSKILVELAKAAGGEIQKHAEGGKLIYPAVLTDDVPNKLVAKVPFEEVEQVAKDARAKLLECWHGLAKEAQDTFIKEAGLPFDPSIWERQTADDYLWETNWSAASLDGRDYKEAYDEAERGLVAAKFTRPFAQYLETGFKDTLSGKREVLHGKDTDGREYWYQVGQVEKITPIKIRPSNLQNHRPRERLDTNGVIKRFRKIDDNVKTTLYPFHGFPSTSSIAAWSFLESAQEFAPELLAKHHEKVQGILPDKKYKIRDDVTWQYDGDLFYPETLRIKRMESDYGKKFPEGDLKPANESLSALYKTLQEKREELRKKGDDNYLKIFTRPSTYYAIIVLDGDGMGEHLRTLDEKEHTDFSGYLRNFSNQVRSIANKHNARVIYNGGDDVLALAPLATVFACARELAQAFNKETKMRTASAGIAISHHLSPLGTALRAARRAESFAKELSKDKNAVCIFALKRSGEPIQVRSGWGEVEPFEKVIEHFIKDEISSRLSYDVARSAYVLPNADDKFESELRRLLKRHWQKGTDQEKTTSSHDDLSLTLHNWASSFPQADSPSQTEELANWLALARFIAKGGRE